MHFLLLVIMFLISSRCIYAELEDYTYIECTTKPCDRGFSKKKRRLMAVAPNEAPSSTNENWCGYVVASSFPNQGKYAVSSISGSWIVPSMKPAPTDTYCSMWIGIDGYGGPTVQQIGTQHTLFQGQYVNYAWYEMFPAPSNQIVGFPVEVGDQITASVVYVFIGNVLPLTSDLFIMRITNDTKRMYSIIPIITQTNMDRSCAEWVVEAPWLNKTLPLSNFGTAFMFNCSAVINNVSGGINNPAWAYEKVTMGTPEGVIKAIASGLSLDGKSFSVTWKNY